MRLGTLRISEGDALRDHPSGACRLRRGDQIGRALLAQARIAGKHVAEARRIEHLRQIGQLMDDDFGARTNNRIA
jgi:hypothetical protein